MFKDSSWVHCKAEHRDTPVLAAWSSSQVRGPRLNAVVTKPGGALEGVSRVFKHPVFKQHPSRQMSVQLNRFLTTFN